MTPPPQKSAMKKNTRRVRISSPTPSDDECRYPTPAPISPRVANSEAHRDPVNNPEPPQAPQAPPAPPAQPAQSAQSAQSAPPAPENVPAAYPPYNSSTSVTAGPNPLYTHQTQPVGVPPGFAHPSFPGPQFHPQFFGAAPPSFVATTGFAPDLTSAPTFTHPFPTTAPGTMAYQHAFPPNYGANFQPPVPDTAGGPMTHTYVPRFDNATGFIAGVPPPGIIVGSQPCPYYTYQFTQPCYIAQHAVPVVLPYGSYFHPANTVQYQNGIPILPAVGPTVPLVNQNPAVQPGPVMMPAGSVPVMGAQVPGCTPVMGAPALVIGGQPQMMPGNMNPNSTHLEPAIGVGLTGMEVAAEQAQYAQLSEPQDFKPGDDDPSRMYMVRQVDGCWTVLSRAAIDGVGDCRWYLDDQNRFYAVRLPS